MGTRGDKGSFASAGNRLTHAGCACTGVETLDRRRADGRGEIDRHAPSFGQMDEVLLRGIRQAVPRGCQVPAGQGPRQVGSSGVSPSVTEGAANRIAAGVEPLAENCAVIAQLPRRSRVVGSSRHASQ